MVSVPSNAGFYCWCIQFVGFFYSRPLNFAINPDEFDLQCVKKPKVPRVCIYNFSEFELTNFKLRSWWCFNSDLTDFTKYHTLKAFCVKHFMQTICVLDVKLVHFSHSAFSEQIYCACGSKHLVYWYTSGSVIFRILIKFYNFLLNRIQCPIESSKSVVETEWTTV